MRDARSSRRSLYRAFAASLSGTSLEYYDFALYSTAAALIFGQLFFAADDPLIGTFQAFATHAVGYLARPLGGIFFGRLGDVIGRKKVLVATLLLVGVSTFLIGLLPGYGQAGIVAPALLVILRFAQGVGVGGEWGGAVLLSSEFSRPGERGFWASAAQVGPALGTLLANGVIGLLVATLSEQAFLQWGWRVAFFLSLVLVGFGLWIRAKLEETPVFRELEARGERSSAPVTEVFQTHRRALAAAILARVGPDVLYAMFAVFVLTYATQWLELGRDQAVAAVLTGSAFQVALIPLAGWLSDRWGRKRTYGAGAVGGALWSLGFFALADDALSLSIGVIGGLVFHSLMYGPQAAFIAEQFHARLRYTGSSLGYTLAGLIGGAVAPMAFTWLLAKGQSAQLIGIYIACACVITLVGLAMGRTVRDEARSSFEACVQSTGAGTMHEVSGGCHCGNLTVTARLTNPTSTYQPRACDCDFCRKHGAAWVSDPKGSLRIQIRSAQESGTYRQGSEQAELLLCRRCGVLVAALLRADTQLYATLNARAFEGVADFGVEQTVSPKKLSAAEKIRRWQGIWFSDVQIDSPASE